MFKEEEDGAPAGPLSPPPPPGPVYWQISGPPGPNISQVDQGGGGRWPSWGPSFSSWHLFPSLPLCEISLRCAGGGGFVCVLVRGPTMRRPGRAGSQTGLEGDFLQICLLYVTQ